MIKTQDYLREFITILFIRKNVVIITSLLFIVGGVLIAFLWPPTFAAQGSTLLKRNEALTSPESIEDVNPEVARIRQDDLFSEQELLTSNSVVNKTAERLIEEDTSYQWTSAGEQGKAKLASKINKNLSTKLVPNSNVIRATMTWGNPTKAQKALETYFDEYLTYRSELYNPEEALSFFRSQIDNFDEQLNQLEQKLVKMAEKGNISDASEQIRTNLLVQKNIENALTELKNELRQKKASINHIEESLKSQDYNFFTSVDDIEIGEYGKELRALVQEKRDLLKNYTEQSSKVQKLQEQIDETYQSVKKEVQRFLNARKAEVEGIKKSIADMKQRLRELEERNVELYKSTIQTDNINRQIDLLDQSYETFAKRLEQANIKSSARTDTLFNVGILSKPRTLEKPVFPQKRRVIGLSIVIGLIAGVTLAFLLEFFDHTFKRPEDVYNFTNLPHICSLPRW